MSPSERFTLDPAITFLNHGSFGACPREVQEVQSALRAEMEREPVLFLHRRAERMLDDAREHLAALVGAAPSSIAFVPNATTGVNTILRSIDLGPGDEVVITNHGYPACRNAADVITRVRGARTVVAELPFPISSADQAVDAIVGALSARTKLVLVDHVTAPTGLVLPIDRIVDACRARGVEVLVDGAHAPGMVPLALDHLGAAYYTGNCHKWLCAPKGCALLYVRPDLQGHVHPLIISHGVTSKRTDRSRFLLEFDFLGTDDPTPYLTVPVALATLSSLSPEGIPGVMAANRRLALEARAILCRGLHLAPPAPDDMIGSLVSLPLPDSRLLPPEDPTYADALQEALFDAHHIEVPIFPWPAPPKRLVRISAQVYNRVDQYERLASALARELERW